VDAWARACERLAGAGRDGRTPHLESFGGSLLGQLCPPSLLIAIAVLEGLFFRQHGVPSVSLSYAQQTNHAQDIEAVVALRGLAAELLSDVDHHVVVYTYMGLFPATEAGARALLRQSARLAVHAGAARLVVKTTAEAHRIPTVAENVVALEEAAEAARTAGPAPSIVDTGLLAEARALVEACLELDPDIGRALVAAFRKGLLDVPYCLHAANAGQARGRIAADGRLEWADTGLLPIAPPLGGATDGVSARELLEMLSYVRTGFDALAGTASSAHVGPGERGV
jgi:methylaspartate mutase epsilon subunit